MEEKNRKLAEKNRLNKKKSSRRSNAGFSEEEEMDSDDDMEIEESYRGRKSR